MGKGVMRMDGRVPEQEPSNLEKLLDMTIPGSLLYNTRQKDKAGEYDGPQGITKAYLTAFGGETLRLATYSLSVYYIYQIVKAISN